VPKDHARRAKPEPRRLEVARHPRARFQYDILETLEAGLALKGSEVKALREGKAQLQEAYARFRNGEVWLVKCHIPEYRCGAGHDSHDPVRPRKLLLHRHEMARLHERVTQKRLTLVPLCLYFNEKGRAKLDLALARGRKLHDKRRAIRDREAKAEVRRASRR
jgi:SsrA-binding protein